VINKFHQFIETSIILQGNGMIRFSNLRNLELEVE
jgi:hypothetical protein